MSHAPPHPPPTHDLVSFDLDGTLVDTAAEIAEAVNRCLDTQGLARRPEAEIVLLIGHGAQALMRQLLARMRTEQPALARRLRPELLLPNFEAQYALTAGTRSSPYPGMHAALAALRQRGIKLACVTNKELRHTQRVLQAHGLQTSFDLVIGGDSLPEKKPDASVLQHVAGVLGVALHRAAHVGDSATDIAAARNAGVAAWAVPYGYNGGQAISQCQPDLIFDHLPAVAAHVLAGRRGPGT